MNVGSFFDRLFRGSASPEATAQTLKESRLHQRHRLQDFDLLTISWKDGQALRLQNLSYGGFALVQSMEKTSPDDLSIIAGTLHLQGEACPFKAKKVREDSGIFGFQFVHDTEETLKFLRPFLENLRAGESMSAIDTAYLNAAFSSRYQVALRGDGPVDLFLENATNGPLNFHMTFRNHKIYHEIRLRDQVLVTGRSFDEDGVATRMLTDVSPDPLVLKQAMQILVGALIQDGPHVASIKRVYEKLRGGC